MIAVSSSGKSFRALAAYLANGRSGKEQERVAWTASRNLPTEDPELAATFMCATAARSDRVETPVYHVALSFDPNDPVDRAAMERVADRVLDRLGLGEHQAIIVAHRDRAHAHLHLLVNRVHPETGKAWERWKDRPLIQEVLREEERSLGLRQVSGTLALRRGEEVQRSLFEETPRPRPDREPRSISGRGRDGDGLRTSAARSRVADLAQAIQAYEARLELERRRYDAEIGASASRARSADLHAAEALTRAAEASFTQSLRAVYREPLAARKVFEGLVANKGQTEAIRTMREEPERLGQLLTSRRPRVLGLGNGNDDTAARTAARSAARRAGEALEARRAAQAVTPEPTAVRREEQRVTANQRALREQVRRAPRKDALERRISGLLERLLPWELSRLKLLVTAPQLAIAQRVRGATQEVALGRED